MARLTKALAVVIASSPLAAVAVAEPSTACPADGGACLARPPVLLQTHQAVGKPDTSGVVLVPPYVAPPGAAPNLTAPPALLQTHQAVGEPDASGVVLVPPYVAPPGAAPNLTAPPVLLQTHQAVGEPDASGVVLVPPYVAPPGAAPNLTARARPSSLAQQRSTPGIQSNTASAQALENFRLLKALRRAGFRCPGGRYFPPNSGELEFDCRLWRAAVGHSLDMGQRNYFSHVTPEGRDPFDRSEPYGLPTFSENIAAGGTTAANTLEQWKKSDGHCTNMMDAGHNRMAVGYAYVASSTYKHYWTQLFGKDSGAPYRSCTGGTDPNDGGAGNGGSGGGGSGAGACGDSESSCQGWANSGFCGASSQYSAWMEDNCKLSCGLCGGSGSGSGGSGTGACGDADSHCSHWSDLGYCAASSAYAGFMRDNCKLSCGLCR